METPLIKHPPRPRTIAVLLVALGVATAGPAAAAAAPWPTIWASYTFANGDPISDPQDENPGYADLYPGPVGDPSSVYVATDGTHIFFRIRVRSNPAGAGGFESTAYVVAIAVGGTQVASVGLDGKSSSADEVYVSDETGASQNVYVFPFTGANAGARTVADGNGHFFVDFQVPISSITAVAPEVGPGSAVQLYYGSSQANNRAVINKDFMTGSSVSFANLETIRLQPATLDLAKTSSVVSGPNPPQVGDTTVYDLTLTASNLGANALQNTTVTDQAPVGVTIQSTSASQGTIGHAAQTVTWTVGTLLPGETALATIRVSVTPNATQSGQMVTLNDGATGSGQDAATGNTSGDTSNSVAVGPVGGAPNQPPVGGDDVAVAPEDGEVTIDVLANDEDPEGGELTVSSISDPPNGTATINPDGTITYVPDANFFGSDSFTYTVCDGQGSCDTATVSVDVAPVNDPPTAVDDARTVNEDTPITFNVLTNDSDVEGDTLTLDHVTAPAHGTVSFTAAGSVTYTPDPDFSGTDVFSYRVCDDGVPEQCSDATITITVDAVNDSPVANDDLASTLEDTPVTINVLANDDDPEGAALSVTAVGGAANGSAVANADGTITYTPNSGFTGTDTFTYTVSDGAGGTDTATVTVTVTQAAGPPVADDDTATVAEDGATDIAVLVGDTDPNGDTLTVAAVTQGAHGSVTINADGTVRYTPEPDFNGSDSFTYRVCDAGGLCDVATVSVTVTPVNDPPVARPDTATTDEDVPVTVAVLANDTDLDGDTLTVTLVSNPANGTATINPDGTIEYAPDPDFFGTDSFTYTISDGNGGTDTATVEFIVVNPVNDAPVANDDADSTTEDTPVTVDVLANDSDVEDDPLSVLSVSPGANGTTSITPDGRILYTPDPDFTGTDTFTYVVTDGNGGSDTATVTIVVGAAADAPIASDDTATVPEDTPVTIDVKANDIDPDGDTLVLRSVSDPAHGSATINVDGTITYTPDPNFFGTDTFTYEVCDGAGSEASCDTATVTVTVEPRNDPPVARDDAAQVEKDGRVRIPVLDNDSDPEGDPLHIGDVSDPAHGTVTVNPDGTITYRPDRGFVGSDSFTYEVCDDAVPPACSVARVTIVVGLAATGLPLPALLLLAASLLLAGGWLWVTSGYPGRHRGPLAFRFAEGGARHAPRRGRHRR